MGYCILPGSFAPFWADGPDRSFQVGLDLFLAACIDKYDPRESKNASVPVQNR
jgi:hypothetical protein